MLYFKTVVKVLFFIFVPIMQLSGFSAWGEIGTFFHPVLWLLVFAFFYGDNADRWLVVFISGFILDLYSGLFGKEILNLLIIATILQIIFYRWLVHRNLVSWMIASFLSVTIYLILLSIWNLVLVNLSPEDTYFVLKYSDLLYFFVINLISMSVIYWLERFFIKKIKPYVSQ